MHSIPITDEPDTGVAMALFGAPEGQDARILAQKARDIMPEDGVVVHIALNDTRMHTLVDLLAFFAPDVKVLSLPAWDCLPYDRVSPHGDVVAQRVAALTTLLIWQNETKRYPRILLTSVNAALQRVMPRETLTQATLSAKKGGALDIEKLTLFLSQNGYIRNDTVRESGDFAIRGGLVDLFPAGYENPIRIDLFGNEIESIKTFDSLTQRTIGEIGEFVLKPATEFFFSDDSIARFRKKYRETFGIPEKEDPLYNAISNAQRYNGMEHWLPLFHDRMETVFNYTPNAQIILDHHAADAYIDRIEQMRDFYEARKTLQKAAQDARSRQKQTLSGSVYNPVKPDELYIMPDEWHNLVANALHLSPFGAPDNAKGHDAGGRKGRNFADIRSLPDGDVFDELKTYILNVQKQGKKTIIAAYSEGSKERLKSLMENAGIKNIINLNDSRDIKKLRLDQTGMGIMPLENGFIAQDIAVLTEQDILGDRLARKAKKTRKAENFLTEVSALNEGDLVVHVDHGIGRFVALETINAAGIINDCLKIEYAGGDKLFVPVVNLEVLSRFGSDEGATPLDKLGGAGWQARKARAKKNLMEIADKLLGIAAARQLRKAERLQISEDLYNEFVARFPYAETEDQERSINAVLENMAGTYPMDHLVCGDVGFGKTEVALRAAYVAAMSGVQVAVVVPTTLLARQHYNNFIKRFESTGIRIAQLSRMVTAKDAKLTKEELADGSVQIVIGTHALFAKNLKFNNLGLLIVDEEQRFGVKQKEKLKELKNNIHVLTLTATPIPRTLQMSLTGVKEMSLITTPPVDRLAIRTFVMPTDQVVIRDALLREKYRGGQSFYVVPRIKDLAEISELLREIVPEVKVIDAHGQMTPTELEDRMTAYYDGQYDVLLATNIIESGIDIPTANTMVVHRADMFGLAQLYQIRGRIGRSKVRAYAYLTYKPDAILNPNAQKRLEVMETLDTLGSGFQLASHDMDIRGAGNLLGDAQSGHIREIGVELYQQMLEEAVAAARAGVTNIENMADQDWSPQINLGASVLIPETYVEDLAVRMSLYRRLSDLDEKSEIEGFAAEMIDRFGPLPDEVENLLEILTVKRLSKKAGISTIEAGPKGALIGFHKNSPPDVDALMAWIARKAGSVKIRPDQKLTVIRDWQKPMHRIKGVQAIVKELAEHA